MQDLTFVENFLRDKCCTIINGDVAGQWLFIFDDEFYFNVECTWRIVAEFSVKLGMRDRLDLTSIHIGMKPVDPLQVVAAAERLIKGKPVTAIRIDQETADLRIEFQGGIRFEAFTDSGRYESWTFASYEKGRPEVVAMGGGDLAVFSGPSIPLAWKKSPPTELG